MKPVSVNFFISINPPMTAMVKISQNVDILAKVHAYLVHLKVEHCQTLRVVQKCKLTFKGQSESTVFDW